jgi:hypothetical protein
MMLLFSSFFNKSQSMGMDQIVSKETQRTELCLFLCIQKNFEELHGWSALCGCLENVRAT